MEQQDNLEWPTITVSDDQCAYCLEDGSRRADPRQLPCGHNFCLFCLKTDFERIKAVRCPVCRKFVSLDSELDKLPSTTAEKECDTDEHHFCDTCENDTPGGRRLAVRHCTKCNMAFCEEHDKAHAKLMRLHTTLSVLEWAAQRSIRESILCGTHKRYPVRTGCKICHKIFCCICWSNEIHKPCQRSQHSGQGHEFDVLENLAQKAKENTDATVSGLQLKKDEVSKMEKELLKMIKILEKSDEKTLNDLETAKAMQIDKLERAVDTVSKAYDEMIEQHKNRAADVQSEVERLAKCLTVIQTRLDHGIEEGRKINSCPTEADVMRQEEKLISAAKDLHGQIVPLFDVNSSLRLVNRELPKSEVFGLEKELVNVPLTYFLQGEGLNLSQIAIRDQPPKELVFCHTSTKYGTHGTNGPNYQICFSECGETAYFQYTMSEHYRAEKYIGAAPTRSGASDNKRCLALNYLLQAQLKVSGKRLILCNMLNHLPILHAINLGEENFAVSRVLDQIPVNRNLYIQSFAVIGDEAIMCTSSEPKFLIWNAESGETRETQTEFTATTRAFHIASRPTRSVLVSCREVILDAWDVYLPDEPEKTPQYFIALVDIDSGNTLWQQFRVSTVSEACNFICYADGYFYILKADEDTSGRTSVEVVDAISGKTVMSNLKIRNLPVNYSQLLDAQIIQRKDGSKRMMLRHAGGIAVVSFSY